MAAGAAYTATLTTRFDSEGTHFVAAKVDYGCRIEEEQEWDNVNTYTLWVNPPLRPDLVVDSLEVEPNPPFAEEWATVRTTVRNQGDKRSGWTWGGFYHDRLPTGCPSTPADVGDEVFYIPPLEPGESATFTAPHRFGEEGLAEVWTYLDYPCTLAESNEDNNESYQCFLLRPPRLPDLIVENFAMEPASARGRAVCHLQRRSCGTAASGRAGYGHGPACTWTETPLFAPSWTATSATGSIDWRRSNPDRARS